VAHQQSGDYRAASALLVRALVTQVAPKRFWRALLLDAVPLLEAPELYFNVEETYEIMRCLEDLLASAADPRILGGRTLPAHQCAVAWLLIVVPFGCKVVDEQNRRPTLNPCTSPWRETSHVLCSRSKFQSM